MSHYSKRTLQCLNSEPLKKPHIRLTIARDFWVADYGAHMGPIETTSLAVVEALRAQIK